LLGVGAVAADRVRRDGFLDPREVSWSELEPERSERLGEPIARARPHERDDVVAARERPGDGDLRDRGPLRLGESAERLDEGEVALEVLAREARG
jgi:hypothetical protein